MTHWIYCQKYPKDPNCIKSNSNSINKYRSWEINTKNRLTKREWIKWRGSLSIKRKLWKSKCKMHFGSIKIEKSCSLSKLVSSPIKHNGREIRISFIDKPPCNSIIRENPIISLRNYPINKPITNTSKTQSSILILKYLLLRIHIKIKQEIHNKLTSLKMSDFLHKKIMNLKHQTIPMKIIWLNLIKFIQMKNLGLCKETDLKT